MPITPRQRWCLIAVVTGLATLLIAHYAIVILYNSRPNPLKVRHAAFISRYIHPLFTQDWHLFSPEPINMDVILLMKTRYRVRGAEATTESAWIDITTPILTRLHRSRLSALGSLAHIHVYALVGRAPAPATREMLDLLCREKDREAQCREARQSLARQGALADRVSARIASAHARKLYDLSTEIVATKIRVLARRVPRFSQRYERNAEGPATLFPESPWWPYERVEPFR